MRFNEKRIWDGERGWGGKDLFLRRCKYCYCMDKILIIFRIVWISGVFNFYFFYEKGVNFKLKSVERLVEW